MIRSSLITNKDLCYLMGAILIVLWLRPMPRLAPPPSPSVEPFPTHLQHGETLILDGNMGHLILAVDKDGNMGHLTVRNINDLFEESQNIGKTAIENSFAALKLDMKKFGGTLLRKSNWRFGSLPEVDPANTTLHREMETLHSVRTFVRLTGQKNVERNGDRTIKFVKR